MTTESVCDGWGREGVVKANGGAEAIEEREQRSRGAGVIWVTNGGGSPTLGAVSKNGKGETGKSRKGRERRTHPGYKG